MAWFSLADGEEEYDTSEYEVSGMYSAGEGSFMDELSEDEIQTMLEASDNTDVYGNAFNGGTADSDPFVNFTEDGKKANILGLPLNFCKTADPNGRVYKDTIMQDLPYVFILPGKPTLNGKLVDVDNKKIKKSDLLNQIENLEDGKFAVRGARTGSDLRFLGFRADYSDYFKYVQTMLSTVHATMGLQGIFDFGDEFTSSYKNHGLCFYADKSTSISESANNDYTESSLVQKANDMSTASREIKTILGVNSDIKDFDSSDASSMMEQMTGSGGIFSRVGSALGRVVNGSQLLYPEIWADSKFDKSYTINFKFYSPYGDKESIFKYVYVPFISLLALSLPRQDAMLGYGQPFVLRLSSPGWFESSMGVVTSIQFTKGGNDNLWTIDNLPQEIEVNLNIKDLYPTLAATKKPGMLAYNLGLASFLDTMAGIRTDQLKLLLRGETFVKTRLSSIKGKFNMNFLSDWGYQLQEGFNNFIR